MALRDLKKIDSGMIAAKSAIDPPAITSCPSGVLLSPASLSTGISTPSEVDASTIAISSEGRHAVRSTDAPKRYA
jgi:hypothetical protein